MWQVVLNRELMWAATFQLFKSPLSVRMDTKFREPSERSGPAHGIHAPIRGHGGEGEGTGSATATADRSHKAGD